MQRINCRVVALHEEVETIWYVTLAPQEVVSFEPGQYLQVVMSESDKRPFSIASSPTTATRLELQIGAQPDNAYAKQVLTKMVQQGEIEIELPLGNAYLRSQNERPLLLLAGGTGFAYTRSILRYLMDNGSQRPVYLYWGARQANWLYELAQLRQWEQEYSPLTVVPVVENPEDGWHGRSGLVHEAILADFSRLDDYDIYVAGRFDMAKVAKEAFIAQGASADHIFGDAYGFI